MNLTQKAIIRTLLYFDLFGHPLDKQELYDLITALTDRKLFEENLHDLILAGFVCEDTGFLYLRNGKSSAMNRISKVKVTTRFYRIAKYVSIIISWHPFVRSVMVSGSLSKKSHSDKDDIDFFIIAKEGRVWVCKTILMMFKKIFLFNSKKFFCINYIIDTSNLEISEKNIFTATELAFLIPMQNEKLCNDFQNANFWIKSFFPNYSYKNNGCKTMKDPFIKRSFEYLLEGKTGDRLDSYFMNLYRKRTVRKYREHLPGDNPEIRNEKNISKYHPHGFQHVILNRYNERITEYESSTSMKLS